MKAFLLFGWTLWTRLRSVAGAAEFLPARQTGFDSERFDDVAKVAVVEFSYDLEPMPALRNLDDYPISLASKPDRPVTGSLGSIGLRLQKFIHFAAPSNSISLAHSRIGQTLKRLCLITCLITLLLGTPLCATMPNAMVWEVRPGTGANTNSGAFATLTNNTTACTGGTDWTQQNAAQVTFNGSTVTATTAGVSATIVITGYTVLSTDVCNTLRVASGTLFTTGLYQIVGVNAGLNTWTLDRTATSGAASTMAGTMGGAMATLVGAFADLTASASIQPQFDCTIWYKSGTDTVTSGVSIPLTSGIVVHGYQTSRGDATGTRPLLTTATNSTNLVLGTASGVYSTITFNNVGFSNTAGTRGAGFYAPTNATGRGLAIINCVLDGFSYGIEGDYNTDYVWGALTIYQTEIKNSVTDGIRNLGTTYIIGSYIHNNGATGATLNGSGPPGPTSLVVFGSIFSSNGTHGISSASTPVPTTLVAQNSVFYGNTQQGISLGETNFMNVTLINNIFDGNTDYGILNSNAASLDYGLGSFFRANNAFYNNGSGNYTGLPANTTDITLSANPFVVAGSNFALNSTAGGGAALKAAGFPGILAGGVGTGYLDVGALQSQCAASAGGGACAFVQ